MQNIFLKTCGILNDKAVNINKKKLFLFVYLLHPNFARFVLANKNNVTFVMVKSTDPN